MDFFGYQQQARRYSVLLLVLFALAVVALVLAVNGVVAWGVLLLDWRHGGYRQLADPPLQLHDRRALALELFDEKRCCHFRFDDVTAGKDIHRSI